MNKYSNYSGISLLLVTSLMLSFSSSTLAAPPNLWWDHIFNLELTQSMCVTKAKNLMESNSSGKITTSEDAVKARGDTTMSIVECLPNGNKIIVMILVSSTDVKSGDKIFNALKSGIRK